MRTIKTIEVEKYEKMDDGIHVKHIGMIKGQEAFDQLKEHLNKVGLLPDEYFLPEDNSMDQELPAFSTAICHTDWGGSEGIYIDIGFQYREGREIKLFPLATGKTLDDSGDAFLKMSRIAAECSIMLNGRGSTVKVSEKHYENDMENNPLETLKSTNSKFTHPFEIEIDEDVSFLCHNFYDYAKAMMLPDPTYVVMPEETGDILTCLVNEGLDKWKLFKSLHSDYRYDDDGREFIEFPSAEKAVAILREKFPENDALLRTYGKKSLAEKISSASGRKSDSCADFGKEHQKHGAER